MANVQRTLTFVNDGEAREFVKALVETNVSFSFGADRGASHVSVSFDGTEEDYCVFMDCAWSSRKENW